MGIILIVFLVLGVFAYVLYVRLIQIRNKVKESAADIDVQLKKRYDLIPNILKMAAKFMEHEKSLMSEQEKQKNDILNELPADVRFQALQNGMSFEDLRSLYAEVKAEYYKNKVAYKGGRAFNNERRQDNVRERVLEQDKERQKEQERTHQHRSRERQYVRF